MQNPRYKPTKTETLTYITRTDLEQDPYFTQKLIEDEQTEILYKTIFITLTAILFQYALW